MEFIVNEAGCNQLALDMLNQMKDIGKMIQEIKSKNTLLRSALGDDYGTIAASVKKMTTELGKAQDEVNLIKNDMNDYMARVHQAKVVLKE